MKFQHFGAATIGVVLAVPGAAAAQAALEACTDYPRDQSRYACLCDGDAAGTVWGSGPYTADSNICSAARHAGVIGAGGGAVEAILTGGQERYAASTMNGIETREWGSYGSSFVFNPKGPMAGTATTCTGFPAGEAEVTCLCAPGDSGGSVWGSGPYTADSDLCAAAVHSGAIGPGGGLVTALGLGGREVYRGSERNGVSSRDWGGYGASFVIDANQ